jgi:hypothetical protein
MSAVWEHSATQGLTRLVFIALADHCDHDGRAWPSVERVAFKCRVSTRTVQRAYAEIERLGEIVRAVGVGRGNTSVYQVVLPGCGQPTENMTVSHPSRLKKVTTGPKKATGLAIKGDTAVTLNRQEPSRTADARDITPVDELPERVHNLRESLRDG